MSPLSRRDALRAAPALLTGLAGCSSLGDDDEPDLPMEATWAQFAHEPRRPVVAGGTLAITGDHLETQLVGFDPETGEERWLAGESDRRMSPPATDGNRAYAVSDGGSVLAVNGSDGAIEWTARIPTMDRGNSRAVTFPPLITGDLLVVPTTGDDDGPHSLTAFSREGGEERFSYELPAPIVGEPAADAAGVTVPLHDGRVVRVDTAGEAQWTMETVYHPSGVDLADGTAYLATPEERVVAVDAETGRERWHAPLENTVVTPPRVLDGTLYVGGADFYVYAFDPESGERLWRAETTNAVTSGPVLHDGRLVSLAGGHTRQREHVPYFPTGLFVHTTDGEQVAEYDLTDHLSGGDPTWVASLDDGVYFGQGHELVRLAPEALDA